MCLDWKHCTFFTNPRRNSLVASCIVYIYIAHDMWICSNYRWLVPLRVARSLKPIVCKRLLARVGATGRGRCGFPCEPLAVSARPVSSDKLVAMAGFDEDDAWDMECSIDMEDEWETPADMEPPVNEGFSEPEDQAAREFEEFQRACVELPVNFEIGEDEVSSPDTRPKAAAVSADRVLPDSTRMMLEESSSASSPETARAAGDARASLDPPTPLTFHVKRQRLRTKTGITSAQGSGYIAVRLRDSRSLASYKAVVQQDRYKARKRVCQMMGRQLGKVRKGLALKLKTGKVLHCTSKEMYQANLTSLTSSILLEIVDTAENPIIAGAAAQKWLYDQGHECLPIPKPKVPDREFVIKSTVAFLTWHGDFGASDVALVSKSGTSLDSLCEQVQSTQAVKKAYQKALSTLQDLQERFGLVDMAVAMEICTRTWAQEQVVKLHVHSWIVQACNREKLRQGDCVIPGATGLPHIQQSSGWKKKV